MSDHLKTAVAPDLYLAFWDTETTGFDPKRDDVIAFGMVVAKVIDHESEWRLESEHQWHYFINTKQKIPEAAIAVHGISQDRLAGEPYFKDAMAKFLKDFDAQFVYTRKKPFCMYLVAHNGAAFDDKMLFGNCIRHNVDYTAFMKDLECHGFIDSLTLIKKYWKEDPPKNSTDKSSFKLSDIHQTWLDRPLEGAHDALTDSKAIMDIFNSDTFRNRIPLTTLIGHAEKIVKGMKRVSESVSMVFHRKYREMVSGIAAAASRAAIDDTKPPNSGEVSSEPDRTGVFWICCMSFNQHDESCGTDLLTQRD